MVNGFSGGAEMGVRTRRCQVPMQGIPHCVAQRGGDRRHIHIDDGIFKKGGHLSRIAADSQSDERNVLGFEFCDLGEG
jgi:hypothetical protein